jgi:hypothetical protein
MISMIELESFPFFSQSKSVGHHVGVYQKQLVAKLEAVALAAAMANLVGGRTVRDCCHVGWIQHRIV